MRILFIAVLMFFYLKHIRFMLYLGVVAPLFGSGAMGHVFTSGMETPIAVRVRERLPEHAVRWGFLKKFVRARAAKDPVLVASLLREYQVAWALVAVGDGFDETIPQIPGWRVHFRDEVAVVIIRRNYGS